MNSIEINPGNNGTITSEDLILFQYTPSGITAYAYMGLFGVCTFVHFVMIFSFRAAYFIPFIIGGIMEVGGYYGRAWAHNDVHNFKAYILQSLLLLVAPTFLAATVYMILGRFITALNAQELSMVRARWLTKLFVLNDIICFLVQIGGAGMQATTSLSVQRSGQKVVITGLVLQILVFCWFIVVAAVFHNRLDKQPTEISRVASVHWKRGMVTIYLASALILVRNIVRVVEYAKGSNGFVQQHEAMVYVFDATLMFLTMLVFNVFHPGFLVRTIRRCEKYENQVMKQPMAEIEDGPLLDAQANYVQVPSHSGLPQLQRNNGR